VTATHRTLRSSGLLCTALAAAALLALFALASPVSAAYEQVGCFAGSFPGLTDSCKPIDTEKESFGEEVQLGGASGLAVNYTGAGVVPTGTVYAATGNDGFIRISMFTPKVDGGLEFRLAWEVKSLEGPYERCGPALGTECPKQVQSGPQSADVDIDQSTGNVYVYKTTVTGRDAIVVYKPNGSEVISRFGEFIGSESGGKTTAETPDKIHGVDRWGPIAVNSSGEVYVYDQNYWDFAAGGANRLMKFVPKTPGDYSEYVYAGVGQDVAAGISEVAPSSPVLDATGNVYVVSVQKVVEMYDPAHPKDPAICKYKFVKGGIISLTVNPDTGESFFFSEQAPKRIRQLGPCNEATGKFEDPASGKELVGEYAVAPEREDLFGLAFDPKRALTGRPPGVLYGGAPSPVPSSVGTGEPGQSSLGYVLAHPVELPPEVKSQSVAHVGTTTAVLGAKINPKGPPTQYAFQYLTQAQYEANEPADRFAGASEAPLGGGFAGEGPNPIDVTASLSGLSPDTAYRFRALASNHCSEEDPEKACEDAGEDASFRTFPTTAPGLPDHRAYELVSPVKKEGGQVWPADPRSSSCGVRPCKLGEFGTHFPMQSSPDGDAVLYEGTPFAQGEGSANENQYIAHRDAKTGWHTTNLTSPFQGSPGYLAFDVQLTRGVLGQDLQVLSPEAPSGYGNLYTQLTAGPLAFSPLLTAEPPNRSVGEFQLLYAGASDDLSRVFFEANDALTETTPFAPTAEDGGTKKQNLYEWTEGQLHLVNVSPGNAEAKAGASFGAGSANAISEDGSLAFWSSESGQAYVRINAESTLEVPDHTGKFLAASTDGSRVLLTDGALYGLDAEEPAIQEIADLTEGKGGFVGLVGQSDDLSRAYFVDTAVLTEEENEQGAKAQAGKFNLYAWKESGAARYVATLVADDNGNGSTVTWSPSPSSRTAQASPNGRYLAFLSKAPITGYDSTGPCAFVGETGAKVPAPCAEAFLYDSSTEKLTCASCNPTGVPPLGWSVLRRSNVVRSMAPSRYLTDEGRLYFDSQDSLSPFDTNEGVEDVYEYEPNGVGTCERAAGCVSLLSAGSEPIDSNLVTIDEGGKSVFFTSRDQLALKDRDDLVDLYVAREDGGIPGESETLRGECQGEACVPQVSPPNRPTPATSALAGDGNADEKKAKKHKHRKKHPKRKHAHKRAKHNRGGAR
jgi:hypothetical protein